MNNSEDMFRWVTHGGLGFAVMVSFAVMTFCARSCLVNELELYWAAKQKSDKQGCDELLGEDNKETGLAETAAATGKTKAEAAPYIPLYQLVGITGQCSRMSSG